MMNLSTAKLAKVFEGEEGQVAIMTDEDMAAMKNLSNEAESNCYVQCKLVDLFKDIRLSVVNSETLAWLVPLSGNQNSDKKPDFIVCDSCFYELRDKPALSDEISAIQRRLLGDRSLLYGVKTGHPLLFLDEISLLEGKFNQLTESDVGQLRTYAGLQARKVNHPAFHRLALFNREKFVLYLSKGGDFCSSMECGWTTPGSAKLMRDFFNVPSALLEALRNSCEALKVVPCLPQINLPCILGAGGSGVVFRVTPLCQGDENTLGRTRSETAAIQQQALKVVVGDTTAIMKEWQAIKEAEARSDRIVSVSSSYCGDKFGAYLMNDVGVPVQTSSTLHKKMLFLSLHNLHKSGVVHGDARHQNAISVSGEIKWIDFAHALISTVTDVSALFAKDFSLLFASLYDGLKPESIPLEMYKECVNSDTITDDAFEFLKVV